MGKCPFCLTTLPQTARLPKSGGLYACSSCFNPCAARVVDGAVRCEPVYGFPDLRHEAVPPVTVTRKMWTHFHAALDNLPVLPEVPQRIMAMAHDPITSLADIARVINEDAVIAMKVLRLANSAFYGSSESIKSLDLACSRLGMKMIIKVVHTAAGASVYRFQDETFREYMQQTWRHAIATAYCAGEVATLMPGLQSDDAFLAGLIHDVGRVVLLDVFSGKYGLTQAGSGGTLEDCLGVVDGYRNVAGLHVAQRWDLPVEFRVSTLCNAAPESIPFDDCRSLSSVVALADRLAHAFGFGCGVVSETAVENHPSLAVLRLGMDTLGMLRSDLHERIDSVVDALAA